MKLNIIILALFTIFSTVFLPVVGWSQGLLDGLETIGKPVPGGINFQPAATDLARDIRWLDNMLLIFVIVTSVSVVILLGIVAVKYNRKSNPVPATFTHHSVVEVTWTVVPVLILIVIGSFSLPILFNQLEIPESEVTIKATGNQWYWSYEYSDYTSSED